MKESQLSVCRLCAQLKSKRYKLAILKSRYPPVSIYLSMSVSGSLSLYLSVCLSVSASASASVSVCLSVSVSIHLTFSSSLISSRSFSPLTAKHSFYSTLLLCYLLVYHPTVPPICCFHSSTVLRILPSSNLLLDSCLPYSDPIYSGLVCLVVPSLTKPNLMIIGTGAWGTAQRLVLLLIETLLLNCASPKPKNLTP